MIVIKQKKERRRRKKIQQLHYELLDGTTALPHKQYNFLLLRFLPLFLSLYFFFLCFCFRISLSLSLLCVPARFSVCLGRKLTHTQFVDLSHLLLPPFRQSFLAGLFGAQSSVK